MNYYHIGKTIVELGVSGVAMIISWLSYTHVNEIKKNKVDKEVFKEFKESVHDKQNEIKELIKDNQIQLLDRFNEKLEAQKEMMNLIKEFSKSTE